MQIVTLTRAQYHKEAYLQRPCKGLGLAGGGDLHEYVKSVLDKMFSFPIILVEVSIKEELRVRKKSKISRLAK